MVQFQDGGTVSNFRSSNVIIVAITAKKKCLVYFSIFIAISISSSILLLILWRLLKACLKQMLNKRHNIIFRELF